MSSLPLTAKDHNAIVASIRSGRRVIPAQVASEWGIGVEQAATLVEKHRPRLGDEQRRAERAERQREAAKAGQHASA